jgi:hypothetical protein
MNSQKQPREAKRSQEQPRAVGSSHDQSRKLKMSTAQAWVVHTHDEKWALTPKVVIWCESGAHV